MADVLDIENAEEFEVDEDGDRKYIFSRGSMVHVESRRSRACEMRGMNVSMRAGPAFSGPACDRPPLPIALEA